MSYNKDLLRRLVDRCDEETAGKLLEGVVVSTDSHGDVTLPNSDISATMIRSVVKVPAKADQEVDKLLGAEINRRNERIDTLQTEKDEMELELQKWKSEAARLGAQIARFEAQIDAFDPPSRPGFGKD